MTAQAVSNIVEYNKIHALAHARKKVIQKYGANLLHFWPMTDDNEFIRDLKRRKPLYAKDVTLQAAGLIDYGLDLGLGYVSDIVADKGSTSTSGAYIGVNSWYAMDIPVGVWRQVEAVLYGTNVGTLICHIAPAGATPSTIKPIATSSNFGSVSSFTWALPFVLSAPANTYALYVNTSGGFSFYKNSSGLAGKRWNGSSWTVDDNPSVILRGANPETMPTYDNFTLGVVANVENCGVSKFLAAICNNSEDLFSISLDSSRKFTGKVKNANGTTYTVTDTRQAHPGYNLVTLSYERNVKVKLGVNGVIVAETVPSDHQVFSGADAVVAFGAKALTNKTASGQLTGGFLDDGFIASGAITDAALLEIFHYYITAAPLLQVEDVTVAQV